jgi:excisionase family DNA binding protein
MSTDPPQKLGTTEDVATYLQVPAKTLAQWRCHGDGPPYHKVGRHVRYRWADVETWLSRQLAGVA